MKSHNSLGLVVGAVLLFGTALVMGFFLVRINEPAQENVKHPSGDVRATTTANELPEQDLSVLMPVPEFSLTDQSGQPFGTDQLYGNAWVVNFMFTRCRATCPLQTARLAEFQRELSQSNGWHSIRFVSVTVDPEYDTPEVLASYARTAGADQQSWKFLTGSRDQIWQLCKEGFRLPAGEDSSNSSMPITHSSKFAVIDPQGYVRGFFESGSDAELTACKRALRRTLDERILLIDDLLNPAWLEEKRRSELATVDQFSVFHGFSFSDRFQDSGINFRHRIVDDAGRSFVTAHYDHGNGISIADVDGDGALDIYFVNQVGGSQLWRNLGGGKFENITGKAGVALPERIGVSASFADTDNDGDADLYATTVLGGNVLFENDGKGIFQDISAASGLGYKGHSSGAVFFDYNRDGLLDLFLVNVGIYTTDKVAAVVNDSFSGSDQRTYTYHTSNSDAFAAHLKPGRAEASILFENQGGNRFVDVSAKVNLVDLSWSGDASALDANDDDWPDLYVVNMQGHDEYYENLAGEQFVRKSRELFPATPWGTMGIKVFDFNNDGRMDIYLTDMHTDMAKSLAPPNEKEKIPKDAFSPSLLGTNGNHIWGNALFRNEGNGAYKEVSDEYNAENYWPWGLSVGDLNADGFQDVFITSSMSFPFRYAVNSLLLNNRGRNFLDSEFILGVEPRRGGRTAIPWFELDADGVDQDHPLVRAVRAKGNSVGRVVAWGALGSRSSVIFDLDNDGDLDIVTNDFNSVPMVLISNLAERKQEVSFLKVRLVGTKSNRSGIGARVTIHCGNQTGVQVHDGKSGYLSQSLCPLYFGLGEAKTVDRLEVRWPSGATQVVPGPISSNTTLELIEQ